MESKMLLLTRYVKQGLVIAKNIFVDVAKAQDGVVTLYVDCPSATKVKLKNALFISEKKGSHPDRPPLQDD
jgi:sRNA-binding carbon storage regulator CsrA